MKRLNLERDEMKQLVQILDSLPALEGVLARHAATDPEAKRLCLALFSESSSSSSRKVLLAGNEAAGEEAGDDCPLCILTGAKSGDRVSEDPLSTFVESDTGQRVLRLMVTQPSLTYAEALDEIAADDVAAAKLVREHKAHGKKEGTK